MKIQYIQPTITATKFKVYKKLYSFAQKLPKKLQYPFVLVEGMREMLSMYWMEYWSQQKITIDELFKSWEDKGDIVYGNSNYQMCLGWHPKAAKERKKYKIKHYYVGKACMPMIINIWDSYDNIVHTYIHEAAHVAMRMKKIKLENNEDNANKIADKYYKKYYKNVCTNK